MDPCILRSSSAGSVGHADDAREVLLRKVRRTAMSTTPFRMTGEECATEVIRQKKIRVIRRGRAVMEGCATSLHRVAEDEEAPLHPAPGVALPPALVVIVVLPRPPRQKTNT